MIPLNSATVRTYSLTELLRAVDRSNPEVKQLAEAIEELQKVGDRVRAAATTAIKCPVEQFDDALKLVFELIHDLGRDMEIEKEVNRALATREDGTGVGGGAVVGGPVDGVGQLPEPRAAGLRVAGN